MTPSVLNDPVEVMAEIKSLIRYSGLGDVEVLHANLTFDGGAQGYEITYRMRTSPQTYKAKVDERTVNAWRAAKEHDMVRPIGLAVQRLRLPVMQLAQALEMPLSDLRRLMAMPRRDLKGKPEVAVVLGAVNRHLSALQEVRDMLAPLQDRG